MVSDIMVQPVYTLFHIFTDSDTLIGLIRKMPTLKPMRLALKIFYFVASTKLRNVENLKLIS